MPDAALRARRQAARPRARHRADRLRQVDDARVAARPRQPARGTSTSSRSRTRSSSCTGTGTCIVNQREIGPDATSFAEALRAALREDPDVILVGEMRDLETIATALTAAETGHLVFATLHTQSAPQTIDRIIDVFPAEQQGQVRVQLAATLQGVVTQNLVPTADGRGRVAALEILIPDDAVRNLIRQAKIEQIYSVMQTSTARGMQTMEQSLADLVQRRVDHRRDRLRALVAARSARRHPRARRLRPTSRTSSRSSPFAADRRSGRRRSAAGGGG